LQILKISSCVNFCPKEGEILGVLDAIRGRRSIRAFKSADVSPEIAKKLLEAARRTSSAGIIQRWEFIIVRRLEIKKALTEAGLNQD
jgi:nitroreductase